MKEEPQLIEKSFVNRVIAVMMANGKDHNQMIQNLTTTNPNLAKYAGEESKKIKSCMVDYYAKTFQGDIVEYCLSQDNPKKAAEEFFKAIKTTPGTSNIQVSVFKQIKNKLR